MKSLQRFCFRISSSFITGAKATYHGDITIEPTGNLNYFHPAPGVRQIRELRPPRLSPRQLPSHRLEIHDFAIMNLGHSGQLFFKSQLTSAWSDLAQWRSLGNLRNEFLITQKSLIDRLVLT
ncbi:MAG TPA: hypothetical protein VEG60_00500 [Candidatus Binatia bacterium]|nr:hypothetical protein [Candidatus Binatia bacterium]